MNESSTVGRSAKKKKKQPWERTRGVKTSSEAVIIHEQLRSSECSPDDPYM